MKISKEINRLGRTTFYLPVKGIIKKIRISDKHDKLDQLINKKVDLWIGGKLFIQDYFGKPTFFAGVEAEDFIQENIKFDQVTKFEIDVKKIDAVPYEESVFSETTHLSFIYNTDIKDFRVGGN